MISYRQANKEDFDWIINILAEDMFSLLGEEDLLNATYLKEIFLPYLIKDGVCIIAIQNNIPIGCIGGIFSPVIYDPTKKILSELFWWVHKEYRGTSAGAKLLFLFEKIGIDNRVNYIHMSIMPNTVLNINSLIKRGYINKESSFVRKL